MSLSSRSGRSGLAGGLARVGDLLAQLGSPWPRRSRWPAYALVCVLSVLLALWEVFLVPLRVGAVPMPLSVVAAPLTTLVLGLAGAVVLGRWEGAVAPGVLWTAVPLLLTVTGSGGDSLTPASVAGALTYLGVITLGPLGAIYAGMGAGRAIAIARAGTAGSAGEPADEPPDQPVHRHRRAAASPAGRTSRQPVRGQRRQA